LSSLGATRATVSANRKADARQLDRAVRGELDWIVMKALEKDRRRRYETANGLAADVQRYLSDEPVLACPPSAWYRFRKLARRNRAAFTTAILVGLALVAGTAVSAWQAIEARNARRVTAAALVQAQSRADETQQVLDYFIKEIIAAANGANSEGRSLTVSEVFRKANDEVGKRFAGRPLLEARLRMVLAEAYYMVGGLEPDEFHTSNSGERPWTNRYLLGSQKVSGHVARTWEIRRGLLGPEHPDTLASRAFQASLLSAHGLSEQAAPLAREVLAARLRVLGPAHPDTIASMVLWSQILGHFCRLDESRGLAERAIARAETSLGQDHRVTLMARQNLASALRSCGRLGEATALFHVLANESERALGPLDRYTLRAWNDLGHALADSGRLEEARRIFEGSVERHSRVYGFCHIHSTNPIAGVERILLRQGDLAGLRDLEQRWIRELLAAPVDPDRYVRHRRAVTLSVRALHLSELAPTIPIDGALAIRAAEEATTLSDTWSGAWTYLGLVYYRLGHFDEAEQAVRAALRRRPDPQEHALDPLLLALVHARRGELAEARAWFDQAAREDDRDNVPLGFGYKELRDEVATLLGLADLPADVFARP
jgi:tetratricopeptide (TPR) repeat protein